MSRKDFIRRMRKSKLFIIGLAGILIIAFLCFLAPLYVQFNPTKSELPNRLLAPEWFANGLGGHVFGCDSMGRDVLTRLLVGGSTSLLIAFSVVIITTVIGLIIGLLAGYYGGVMDLLLMRICDIMMALPTLLLAICVVAVMGASVTNLVVVLSITGWIMVARVVRSTVMTIRNSEYIKAAIVLGIPNYKIIFKEVLPNVVSPVIITATQAFGGMILTEASMSFLGLGVPAPAPSWGAMISDGREYIATAPWVVIVPGIALMLVVLAFNFLGDGLNDIMNPKNKD
ncbi:MAG: ABC transporter permease [Clostridium sp.]|nr:ABC transporter permease [Clostridium sp.]